MKKIVAILGLLSISFTVRADMATYARTRADERVRLWNYEREATANPTRDNLKKYYGAKLSSCLFEQKLNNVLSGAMPEKRNNLNLVVCSEVISEALENGNLNDTDIKDVIDDLAQQEKLDAAESAIETQKRKALKVRTTELIEYGNQKLNN